MSKVTWKVGPFHEGGHVLMRMDPESKYPITTVRLNTLAEAQGAYSTLSEYLFGPGHRAGGLDAGKPKTREEEEEAAWRAHKEDK